MLDITLGKRSGIKVKEPPGNKVFLHEGFTPGIKTSQIASWKAQKTKTIKECLKYVKSYPQTLKHACGRFNYGQIIKLYILYGRNTYC